MNPPFYLVTWVQFEKRRANDKTELLQSAEITEDIKKLMQLNAEKRLTTAEYKFYNISELLANNSLEIKEKVNEK